jgi:hypothetical protein
MQSPSTFARPGTAVRPATAAPGESAVAALKDARFLQVMASPTAATGGMSHAEQAVSPGPDQNPPSSPKQQHQQQQGPARTLSFGSFISGRFRSKAKKQDAVRVAGREQQQQQQVPASPQDPVNKAAPCTQACTPSPGASPLCAPGPKAATRARTPLTPDFGGSLCGSPVIGPDDLIPAARGNMYDGNLQHQVDRSSPRTVGAAGGHESEGASEDGGRGGGPCSLCGPAPPSPTRKSGALGAYFARKLQLSRGGSPEARDQGPAGRLQSRFASPEAYPAQ